MALGCWTYSRNLGHNTYTPSHQLTHYNLRIRLYHRRTLGSSSHLLTPYQPENRTSIRRVYQQFPLLLITPCIPLCSLVDREVMVVIPTSSNPRYPQSAFQCLPPAERPTSNCNTILQTTLGTTFRSHQGLERKQGATPTLARPLPTAPSTIRPACTATAPQAKPAVRE